MFLSAILSLLPLSKQSAYASDTPALIIGVENIHYMPHYTTRDGVYQGFARKMLDRFAREQGFQVIYRPLPLNRLYHEFVIGKLDLKYPDNPQWSNDIKGNRLIHYSRPVVPYIDGAIVRRIDLGRGLDGLDVLGTVRGFTPFSYLQEITSGRIILLENTSTISLLTLLENQRIQALYANPDVLGYLLRQQPQLFSDLAFDPDLPHSKGYYRLSSIKYPKVIRSFDLWMARHAEELSKMRDEFGIPHHLPK